MQINIDALNTYLAAHCPQQGTVQSAEKFKGGQSNPTFLLNTTEGKFVLRCQPQGKLLKSAHAVDREYRVMRALHNSAVPVPYVYHLCENAKVLGSMYYIMEFIPGQIFWNSSLPGVGSNTQRSEIYDQMNSTLAALHDIDVEQAGLADYGKPGNYFARQLSRWTQQYRASETSKIAEIEELIEYLNANLPDDDGQVSLVHGDYRLDNMIFDMQGETPRLLAILDWELSTLGHPYADLAYQCMQLRLPATLSQAPGLQGVNRQERGIPTEAEYVQRYCQRRGVNEINNWSFYLAFSFFRLAAILQGVAKRAIDGNAVSDKAAQMGAMVQPLAVMALTLENE